MAPYAPPPGPGHAARLRQAGALILTLAGAVLVLGGVVTAGTTVLAGAGMTAAGVAHLLGDGEGTGTGRRRVTSGLRICAVLALVAYLVTRLTA